MRDIRFYNFAVAISRKAKQLKSISNTSNSLSINVEFGYGGARLMDVRWTGFKSITKLCECLYYCNSSLKLRVVGSSAGNVIVYSLATILAMKGKCCGYNIQHPQKRGRIINRRLFYEATGLDIPENIECACEGIRTIFDFLLEEAAVKEHPTAQRVPTTDAIREMFAGTQTAESLITQRVAAFSNLFENAPVRYALSLYRAISGLEGRVGTVYSLSRYLLLFCIEWVNERAANSFFDVCEFYIGARKIVDDEGFVFTDLVGMVPLVHLSPITFLDDVKRFNTSVDILMESIDVRGIILPYIFLVIWQQTIKRLKLRNDKSLSRIRNWRWNGKISTPRSFSREDYEMIVESQISADIMTNSDNEYLPDFEKVITRGADNFSCWNYIFELSPRGKHLFQLERVSGVFEAGL